MMFKDKYIHKLYAFALAAVFALTLAGCGGGGGTAAAPDPEPPTMPEPTAQEMCEGDGGRYNADGSCTSAADLAEEMALSGAQEAAMAAAAAVAGAKDPVAAANAQAHATAAMAASASAAAAETSAMAMEYKAAAEAARDMAMEAAGTRGLAITKLANAVANKSAIDSATLVGVPAPAPISNAGRVGAALRSVARGDVVSFDQTTGQNPKSSLSSAVSTTQDYFVYSSARHTGSAPRLSVSVSPDGGTTLNALQRGETPSAVTTRGGFAGAELTRSVSGTGASKENALVFTDINPPKQAYYADETAAGALATNFYTNTELGGVRNEAVVTGDIPGDGSHFAGTLNPDPTDNNPPITGRFVCPSTATDGCSISVTSTGVLVAVEGYEFRNAIAGSVNTQDSDYLTWGVWIRVPNAVPTQDDTTTTENENAPALVAAFASGSDLFSVPAALTGTATYNGVATGLYSAAGMVEYFDADVSLTADFGGKSANDATPTTEGSDSGLLGAVTGTVSNIKAGGMDLEGSFTLNRAPLISGDDTDLSDGIGTPGPATRFTGTVSSTLGGRALSGRWGGRFYGPQQGAERIGGGSNRIPHDGCRHLRRQNACRRPRGQHPGRIRRAQAVVAGQHAFRPRASA